MLEKPARSADSAVSISWSTVGAEAISPNRMGRVWRSIDIRIPLRREISDAVGRRTDDQLVYACV